MICTLSMVTEPIWMPLDSEMNSAVLYSRNWEPNSSRAALSRKNETPIAVINGAIRGASRSGR